MSASHRKLARLPLEIFDNLHLRVQSTQTQKQQQQQQQTPEGLRSQICNRLKRFPYQSSKGGSSTTASIKTVGDLLRANKRTLLIALDPLLTFPELDLLLKRICKICSAKKISALSLLESTNDSLPVLYSSQSSNSSSFGDRLRYLPTGLKSLDTALQGGIRVGSVTEIVGRAGAGKTQLAFQLCLLAAKYNQGSMYIDTERKISLERLAEMSQHRYNSTYDNGQSNSTTANNNNTNWFSYQIDNGSGSYSDATQSQPNDTIGSNTDATSAEESLLDLFSFKSPEQVLANMTVETPSSTEELIQTLDAIEEVILHRNQQASSTTPTTTTARGQPNKNEIFPIRLLIVDSIAAPLQRDFGSDAYVQRSAAIFSCAQILRRLAESLHLAVVVINQVGAVGNNNNNYHTNSNIIGNNEQVNKNYKSPLSVKAALGTSWHHCVSTRLVLDQFVMEDQTQAQNENDGWTDFGNLSLSRRTLQIAKSNIVPNSSTHFEICNEGIVDTPTSI